tara:strand:+ start:16055 stop:16648 length:594 start_codon:yes stop_codon:yes gene_type:complete
VPKCVNAESKVSFQSRKTKKPITTLQRIDLHAQSRGPKWLGLHIETGTAEGWDGNDLMVNGHFLTMNMAAEPLALELRDNNQLNWSEDIRQPGAFWIHPEGSPFSLRHHGHSKWAIAIIDGKFMDSVLGGHYQLIPGTNITNPILEYLFKALIEKLQDKNALAPMTQSLTRSFVMALGLRQGRRIAGAVPKTLLTQF